MELILTNKSLFSKDKQFPLRCMFNKQRSGGGCGIYHLHR